MHPSCIVNAEKFVSKYLSPDATYKVLDVGSFNINGTLKPLFVNGSSVCDVCGRTFDGPAICCAGYQSEHRAPGVVAGHTRMGEICNGIIIRPISKDVRIGKTWTYIGMDLKESCNSHGDMNSERCRRYNVDLLMDDPHKFPLEDDAVDVVVSTSCLEHDTLFWLTFDEMVRVVKPGGLLYINVPSNGPYHGFPDDCWRFQADAYKALAQWNKNVHLVENYIDTDVQSHGGWADNVGIFRVQKHRPAK